MKELKEVVIVDGKIFHVGDWDYQIVEVDGFIHTLNPLPDGATIEQREMAYTSEYGWKEVGQKLEPYTLEKMRADIMYLAIMTGVDL